MANTGAPLSTWTHLGGYGGGGPGVGGLGVVSGRAVVVDPSGNYINWFNTIDRYNTALATTDQQTMTVDVEFQDSGSGISLQLQMNAAGSIYHSVNLLGNGSWNTAYQLGADGPSGTWTPPAPGTAFNFSVDITNTPSKTVTVKVNGTALVTAGSFGNDSSGGRYGGMNVSNGAKVLRFTFGDTAGHVIGPQALAGTSTGTSTATGDLSGGSHATPANPPLFGAIGAISNNTNVCAMPAGIAAGNLLLMFVENDGGGTVACAGWTLINSFLYAGHALALLQKIATGSEGASQTVTGGSTYVECVCLRYTLFNTTTPINVYGTTATNATASLSTTSDKTMELACVSYDNGSVSAAAPAGWTRRLDGTGNNNFYVAVGMLPTAGPTGTTTFQNPGGTFGTFHVVIAPVPGAIINTVALAGGAGGTSTATASTLTIPHVPGPQPLSGSATGTSSTTGALTVTGASGPDHTNMGGWWDGADTSTFTLAGTSVSQWRDKSGLARHLAQANGSYQPFRTASLLNSLPAVQFLTPDFMVFNGSNLVSGTTFSLFVVYRLTAVTNYARGLSFWSTSGNGYDWDNDGSFSFSQDPSLPSTGAATAPSVTRNYSAHGGALTGYHGVLLNTWMVASVVFNGSTGAMYINGTVVETPPASTGTFDIDNIGFATDGVLNGTTSMDVAEVLIYSDAKVGSARTSIEGYLNRKWFTAYVPGPVALAGSSSGTSTVTGALTGSSTGAALAGRSTGFSTAIGYLTVPGTTTTVLYDDFSGSALDLNQWVPYNRIGDLINNEVNGVTPNNVRVANGSVSGKSLFIDSKFEDIVIGDSQVAPRLVHYTSGQIASVVEFLYGRVEFRAKMPGGTGCWPDLWMLGYGWHPTQAVTANDPGAYPESALGEIDIAEFMYNGRTSVNCQIHYNDGSGHVDPGGFVGLSYDATSRFIVYRLDWSPGRAVFLVDYEDGTGFHAIQTITGSSNVPNTRMYAIIHTAIGGNGGGTPDSATFPQTMEVDYVRITQPGPISLAGTSSGTSTAVASTLAKGPQVALVGTAAGTSTVTGSRLDKSMLLGTVTVPGTSTTIGTLTTALTLTGRADGTCTANGSLSVSVRLSSIGDAAGTSTATATTLITSGVMGGTSTGTSTATGALGVVRALAGGTAGTSTASATGMTSGVGLAGTSAGTSTASGFIADAGKWSSLSQGTSTVTGALSVLSALSGRSDGTSATLGALARDLKLAGTSNGVSTTTATGLDTAQVFGGTINGTSTAVGTMQLAVGLVSVPVTGGSTVQGSLQRTRGLVAASTGRSTAIGALTVFLVGGPVRIWDGTKYVAGILRVWDGQQWVQGDVNVWTGSEFQHLS